jgi:hypothetical protein
MDPQSGFVIFIFGGVALLIVSILLLGRFYPGSGADQLRWRPTRSPETEVELELDDVDQMLEAQNEIRRRRGAHPRSLEEFEHDLATEEQQWRLSQ